MRPPGALRGAGRARAVAGRRTRTLCCLWAAVLRQQRSSSAWGRCSSRMLLGVKQGLCHYVVPEMPYKSQLLRV
jgi:hypothetical protein